MDAIDELFEDRAGRSWLETLPDEITDWLQAVADRASEYGWIPKGKAVMEAIEGKWGRQYVPKSDTTVRDTIRRLQNDG